MSVSEEIFGYHKWKSIATGIYWVEPKDATKRHILTTKKSLDPQGRNAKTEQMLMTLMISLKEKQDW